MTIGISKLADAGQELTEIPVHINYDIIHLFSEGLYRSPHKAIEELVSNSYDADAERVHILLPEESDETGEASAPLWVIDDGHGMNEKEFHELWLVAESTKTKADKTRSGKRAPIGQFGIGKLAAYVLAWNLTHLSCVDNKILLTSMNFRTVMGRRQAAGSGPVQISLREIDEETAKEHLAEIKERDPAAWKFMFDEKLRSETWTAAGLSDFRELYNKLSAGRLRWILSTGLPLDTNFSLWLNGARVQSSKENLDAIKSFQLGSTADTVATALNLTRSASGNVELPGIGEVSGTARIYERPITSGKSSDMGRSNGFFIRVRGRVINLDDELFGIEALNHRAWSRFALKIQADGLREHLLSSREGVKDSEDIRKFRDYIRRIFNSCRSAYEATLSTDHKSLDIAKLLSDTPSVYVTDPLFHSVRSTIESGLASFYIDTPALPPDTSHSEWLGLYENEIAERPFDQTTFDSNGPHAPALRYDPGTRRIIVNIEHPYVDKLTAGGKLTDSAKLFASSEVLLEGQLQDQGIDLGAVSSFMMDRDRVLRIMAGDAPPTAAEVLRRLDAAMENPTALERAVGAVFRVLGFRYERKGGSAPGPDGVLYARLGRHREGLADYSLVYDAKQTNQPSVPADHINLASLEDFRSQSCADFGFFIAGAYQAEAEIDGAINRRISTPGYESLLLLKVNHLHRLIWLHYQYGVTLTELRSLFRSARTAFEVDTWIDCLEDRLAQQGKIPLRDLLEKLDQEKRDTKATPNIAVVRSKSPPLLAFDLDHLVARLKAVENIVGTRWIEVEAIAREVIMHQSSENILAEFERNISDLTTVPGLGVPEVT